MLLVPKMEIHVDKILWNIPIPDTGRRIRQSKGGAGLFCGGDLQQKVRMKRTFHLSSVQSSNGVHWILTLLLRSKLL